MRYVFDAIDVMKEKNELVAGRMVFMSVWHEVMQDSLDIGQEFSELQDFLVHLTSSVREVNANGMHIETNLPDVRKNFSELTEE
jgi:hypothetical protein